MDLYWKEDPIRPGRCWDLWNEKGFLCGYVLRPEGAQVWVASNMRSTDYDTKEEAMAVVLALVRMEGGT